MEELFRNEYGSIRYYVASNPSASDVILIRLSKDRNNDIRHKAIINKSLEGVLKEIVRLGLELDEEEKLYYQELWPNRIRFRVELKFFQDWEERYFHEI